MIKINKLLLLLAITTLISIFTSSICLAQNHVEKIEIDVSIHNNGSATITQRWAGSFDEGTEVYLPIEDNNLIVRNLQVWKSGREYLRADGWDADWSFDSKKWRCGINRTSKGVELCFGISEYGNNIYTFSYDIDPLVKSYTDADGFNFQFVNPYMGTFPSDVSLRIKVDDDKKLSTDNARIWGFGYDGMTAFSEDGYAVAYSLSPLSGSNYMNITLEIYKGLLAPNVAVQDTFENAILNPALEGSTFAETLANEAKRGISGMSIATFLFIALMVFGFIYKIVSRIKRKAKLKKFYNDGNYFRDTPNGGNIAMSYVLYQDFDIWNNKDTNVIGAIIMKMINDGNFEPIQEKSYGLFGKEKITTNLKIVKAPEDPILRELFDIVVQAAGPDNILQEKELKQYASKNDEVLANYIDSLESKGHNALNKGNCYLKVKGTSLDDLNDDGKKELGEVFGLRKFLDEFTLIDERGVTEGIIWEDLIVYATLFGIAKKVLTELKNVYPERLVEIEKMSNTYYVSDLYFRTLYYSALDSKRARALQAASAAARGFGGMASMSGGGGFSGGGSGGGTR